MNEGNKVAEFIYNRLAADTSVQTKVGKHPTLKIWQIYEVEAPQNASTPYIVFMPQTPFIRRGAQAKKIFRMCDYIIKGVDRDESFATVGSIADRIDALFQTDQLLDDDDYVAGCSIVGDIQYSTIEDGVNYKHMGSIVEIFAYGLEA